MTWTVILPVTGGPPIAGAAGAVRSATAVPGVVGGDEVTGGPDDALSRGDGATDPPDRSAADALGRPVAGVAPADDATVEPTTGAAGVIALPAPTEDDAPDAALVGVRIWVPPEPEVQAVDSTNTAARQAAMTTRRSTPTVRTVLASLGDAASSTQSPAFSHLRASQGIGER